MTGDAFKLPERFAKIEGSSAVGWIMIALANLILLAAAAVLFYNYLLLQHFNGRVWDLYWRLTALEQDMFVPEDLELSKGGASGLNSTNARASPWLPHRSLPPEHSRALRRCRLCSKRASCKAQQNYSRTWARPSL